MRGYGHKPYFVEGDDPPQMHRDMATVLDQVATDLEAIKKRADEQMRPLWPMIVLRTPKGWTGPDIVDGQQVEGTFRSHQVPLSGIHSNPAHLKRLEEWLLSYRPHELFTESGALRPEIAALAPEGNLRMSASPHANGGVLLRELDRPDFRDYAVPVPSPGTSRAEATRVLGQYLAGVIEHNRDNRL
jgi:xylulose-5-phosphate/fructose-6-phosphate phosphoketolase